MVALSLRSTDSEQPHVARHSDRIELGDLPPGRANGVAQRGRQGGGVRQYDARLRDHRQGNRSARDEDAQESLRVGRKSTELIGNHRLESCVTRICTSQMIHVSTNRVVVTW